MRTLRSRELGFFAALAGLALALWAGPVAASTVEMVWIQTSAPGALGVGTPTLTVFSISDTAVLEIRVTVDAPGGAPGIEALGVSFAYDGAVILGAGKTLCPATPNNAFGPGSCGGFGTAIGGPSGFLGSLLDNIDVVDGPLGLLSDTVVGTTPGNGQSNGAVFELAHITFHIAGPGKTGAAFLSVFDGEVGIGGILGAPTLSGATISVVPEPGTAGLLGLGLAALALVGRRCFR